MNIGIVDGYSIPDFQFTLTWNAGGDTLTMTPDTLYGYNTVMSVVVIAGADLSGNLLPNLPDTFLSFTTIVGDTVKPHIVSTSPADGATDVALDEPVVFVFSEPMDTSSFIGYSDPDHAFSLSWSSTGDTVTLTPDVPYLLNTTYAMICTSATDVAGNPLAVLPDTISFTTTPTGVEGKPEAQAYVLQLSPVAPNPMNAGRATFQFSLPTAAHATLEVFNVLGQKVNTLVDGNLGAGNHTVNWNGADRNGNKLTSGVYIYQLKIPGKTLTKRLTIIR